MNKALSGLDISKILGEHKCKIMNYKDLTKYNTLDKLFGNKFYIIIIYETRKHWGHWCVVIKRNNNTYEFFDSYGKAPDYNLKYIPKNFRNKNNMRFTHLVNLLLNCNKRIEYNDYHLQKYKKGYNTCGRWVIVRCLLSHDYNIDEFVKFFINKKKSPDQIVTEITNEI